MLTPEEIAKKFHTALARGDWTGPGDNEISGTAIGGDSVVERAKLIASYDLSFELENILLSRDNMALGLHNTGERDGARLDEKLATVCRLREGRIAEIETFLSDVPGMNRFFARGG